MIGPPATINSLFFVELAGRARPIQQSTPYPSAKMLDKGNVGGTMIVYKCSPKSK